MKFRFFNKTGDRIAFWASIAMVLVMVVISALRQFAGLTLVHGELYVFLPLFLILLLLGWGMSAIFRRLKNKVIRWIFGAATAIVLMALMTIAMSYGSFAASLAFPSKYVKVTAPNGQHSLMVMRRLDADDARIEARKSARLAADPASSAETTAADMGYVYTAYSTHLFDFFYKNDTLLEGEVCIGYASKAELMVEWEDAEHVGHFYVKNPEVGDGGEMRALSDHKD